MAWRFSGHVLGGKYAGPWRVGDSIKNLAELVDDEYPGRSRVTDGTLGNTQHTLRRSDHNPWVRVGGHGIVTAIDITHDPASGADMNVITRMMRVTRHPAIKYVIFDGRIFSSTTAPWKWRTYYGLNKHRHHAHISVLSTEYDNPRPWVLPMGDDESMKQGDQGQDVARFQDALNDLGYGPLNPDGDYGPATGTAVSAAQADIGFTVNSAYASAAFLSSLFARQHPGIHMQGAPGPKGAPGPPGSPGPPGPPGPSPTSATFTY